MLIVEPYHVIDNSVIRTKLILHKFKVSGDRIVKIVLELGIIFKTMYSSIIG